MNWTKNTRRAERRWRNAQHRAQGFGAWRSAEDKYEAHSSCLWGGAARLRWRIERWPENEALYRAQAESYAHSVFRKYMSGGAHPWGRHWLRGEWDYYAVSMLRSQIREDLRMECEWLEELGRGHRRPRLYLECVRGGR